MNKISKKEIETKYNNILDNQRYIGKLGEFFRVLHFTNLLIMIPVSFLSLMGYTFLLSVCIFNVFFYFGAYIWLSGEYSKLEVFELYYLTLLKRTKK